MKRFGLVVLAGLVAVSVAMTGVAEAKRIGGGSSMGTQRSIAPPASSAPSGAASQPVMPATPGATLPARPATPAATPAAAPAKSFFQRWAAPLAGLAAGLGLAALLSHFGLPEGIGGLLLVAAFFIAMAFLVRMLLARRASPTPAMQYAGRVEPQAPRDVFRAETAPAWGGAPKPEPTMAPAAQSTVRNLPPGFDAAGFAEQAKSQFRRLQAAYDAADRSTLADVMTPQMFAEISRDLDHRFGHQPTEIESLSADVLEVATEGNAHWASVRYTGRIREDGEATAKGIDEVWNLTKPVDGSSGWLLAGIQQTA